MTTTHTPTPVESRRHRLHNFAGRAHQVLDEVSAVPTWSLTAAERAETVAEIEALKDRLTACQLGLVADADQADDAATAGCTNTGAWVRSVTGLTGRSSSGVVRQAQALAQHPQVADALGRGDLRVEQAKVIIHAVDALPAEVADQAALGEAHLLQCAREHDATALQILGKRLLEVVAPDQADALIAKRLEAEEREAEQQAYLQTWSDGHGSRHLKGKIPELHAVMLDTMLAAIANPSRPNPLGRDGVTSAQVRGRALCQLLERVPVKKLPTSGGVNAQVVVTMTLDTLTGGLAAANLLGTGHQLSPGQARRLAAEAGVIPAVLGGPSVVLDLGRRRSFNTPQRLALAIRQHGLCNITGCDRPATWCDSNHIQPYAEGGLTTLTNGELACSSHHTKIHQGFTYPRRT